VYVKAFDRLNSGTKRRWQIFKGGGFPRWGSGGNELFYITADGRMMVMQIRIVAGGAEAGAPRHHARRQRFILNSPLESDHRESSSHFQFSDRWLNVSRSVPGYVLTNEN
jgi:hypothetical protein